MSDEIASSPPLMDVVHTGNILVVEDDVALRFTLAEWLRGKNYTVYEAKNADEAMTLIVSAIRIDLMVTDIDMPGTMNGFGLIDRVRQGAYGLKIIVVSGNAASPAAKERDVPFFRKPYNFESLTMLIDTLIGPDITGLP